MVDSSVVLWGQTLVYTLYCLVIILLMIWFGVKVTTRSEKIHVKPKWFYSFVGFLAVIGISLHIITYNTIPWAPMDINRDQIRPDKTFVIQVANHRFILPDSKMVVKTNDKVLFRVSTSDLTYGFGLFRADNSMVFQMQVVPGHKNEIIWQFARPGSYTIRSTEYSGPLGTGMVENNVFEVEE